MMKKMMLFVLICLMSNVVYAQGNYLDITTDVCNNEMIIDSNHNISTEFNIEDLIIKSDKHNIFTFSYRPEVDTNLKLKMILPENMIISEKNDVLLLTRPAQISTDGRKIYIEWSKELKAGEEITIFTQYELKQSNSLDSSMIISILIIFLIAFVIGYRTKRTKKEKFIEKSISADEKILLNIIKKDGEIMQEDLRKKTDWSKTKISKVLRNLESKELIEKKPYRKTNKLSIKK